jgi:ketosteroid isomerase-like protein
MASANVKLVHSVYTAWKRGNFNSAEWADPEIEYAIAGVGRWWTGVGGRGGLLRDFLSAWEGWRDKGVEYREVDDERVLVLTRARRREVDRGAIRAKGASLFHIRDGKVTKLVAYVDSGLALFELGLTPEPSFKRMRNLGVGLAIAASLALSLALVWLFLRPWLILQKGPVGSHHSLLAGYWAVSPTPTGLWVRGLIGLTVILTLIFEPTGWIREKFLGAEEPYLMGKIWVALILPLFWLIGMFAATDRQAASAHPTEPMQCFGVRMVSHGHVSGALSLQDALYFTVGNLTTAGTGSVQPISTTCRALVTEQTAIGAVAILLGVGGALWRIFQHPAVIGSRRRSFGAHIGLDELHELCRGSALDDWQLVLPDPPAARRRSYIARAAYVPDLSISLAWGLPDKDKFDAPWVERLGVSASSHWLDLFYNGVLVERQLRIFLGRQIWVGPEVGLPLPCSAPTDDEATPPKLRITKWQRQLFAVVDALEHCSELESALWRLDCFIIDAELEVVD